KLASRTFVSSSSATAQTGAAAPAQPQAADKRQETAEVAPPPPVEVDMFELSEPSPVLSKLTPTFHDGIGSTKWSERRDALEELLKLVSKPRLSVDSYGDVVNKLAGIIEQDANVPVTKLAIEVVDAMCKGLRQDFSSYARQVLPLLT